MARPCPPEHCQRCQTAGQGSSWPPLEFDAAAVLARAMVNRTQMQCAAANPPVVFSQILQPTAEFPR
jgi:hypothetical protein